MKDLNQMQVSRKKIEPTLEKVLNETIVNELAQFINDIGKYDIPDEVMVECGFWDFAGQRHYYPTHQIFLNSNAVHLLVADIMKDIKQISTEVGYDKIGEYIDFWFDSIHSCGAVEGMESTGDCLNPPVILVCTGIDKCKDKLDERKNEFRKQLLSILHSEDKRKHLRRICCISNIEPSFEDFNYLRQSIFEIGQNIESFGEKLPLRWIRLEQILDLVRGAGVNILSWADMTDLASKCSIENEKEVSLFLKYHHKIGSIIYFASLGEHIILDQKWLADAFRCFVSDKFDNDLKLTQEWKTLEDTGELKSSLIEKLFQKEHEKEFYKHESLLLKIMEMFGIIVKIAIPLDDEQNTLRYYMPCMISEKTSIWQIYDVFGVRANTCTQSPWLCIQFDFMPFDFFNHIFSHYVKKYSVCMEASSGRLALYHGIGVFFHDESKSRKFILCFSKNTIALQIWQWRKLEQGKWQLMLKEVESVIHAIKDRYEPKKISYSVKTKCANGNIQITAGRYTYKELTDLEDEEYFCEEHNEMHHARDFFCTWYEEYSEYGAYAPSTRFKGIQNERFNQKCHVCDRKPCVWWCQDCQRMTCKDCNSRHQEAANLSQSLIYPLHILQHVEDMYSLDYKYKVNAEAIEFIQVLHDDLLIISNFCEREVVIFDILGQKQHQQNIILPGYPGSIAIVDNNTVAVALMFPLDRKPIVIILDVRQKQVVQRIDVNTRCYGIMYRENQLFVGCLDRTIKVINMSGKVTQTIPVGVVPHNIYGGVAKRIYYTDDTKLYCIDEEGNALFTFTHPDMRMPWGITTDDEGHLLLTCRQSFNVFRISPDGKQSQVIIKKIEMFGICYHSLSKSVVFGGCGTVYVYKKSS